MIQNIFIIDFIVSLFGPDLYKTVVGPTLLYGCAFRGGPSHGYSTSCVKK